MKWVDGYAPIEDYALDNGAFLSSFELVRGIEGISGVVPMRWRITPRFGAGERRKETTIERLGTAVLAASRPAILAVYPFEAGEPHHTDDEITGSFELGAGERASLVLRATSRSRAGFSATSRKGSATSRSSTQPQQFETPTRASGSRSRARNAGNA